MSVSLSTSSSSRSQRHYDHQVEAYIFRLSHMKEELDQYLHLKTEQHRQEHFNWIDSYLKLVSGVPQHIFNWFSLHHKQLSEKLALLQSSSNSTQLLDENVETTQKEGIDSSFTLAKERVEEASFQFYVYIREAIRPLNPLFHFSSSLNINDAYKIDVCHLPYLTPGCSFWTHDNKLLVVRTNNAEEKMILTTTNQSIEYRDVTHAFVRYQTKHSYEKGDMVVTSFGIGTIVEVEDICMYRLSVHSMIICLGGIRGIVSEFL